MCNCTLLQCGVRLARVITNYCTGLPASTPVPLRSPTRSNQRELFSTFDTRDQPYIYLMLCGSCVAFRAEKIQYGPGMLVHEMFADQGAEYITKLLMLNSQSPYRSSLR